MEQGERTKKLAEQFEELYTRHIEREAKEKVRESMKNGKIVKVDGNDSDEEEVNQSIKEIQQNTMLTQAQRQSRVEAEVGFIRFFRFL
jgi:uncharacterized protein YecA (UPF0149 family)